MLARYPVAIEQHTITLHHMARRELNHGNLNLIIYIGICHESRRAIFVFFFCSPFVFDVGKNLI